MSTLRQAIELSESIQDAIRQHDWKEVATLDSERLKLIGNYYRATESIDENHTRILKEVNDQIVKSLTEIQQQIRTTQLELKQGTKVSRAYLDNA